MKTFIIDVTSKDTLSDLYYVYDKEDNFIILRSTDNYHTVGEIDIIFHNISRAKVGFFVDPTQHISPNIYKIIRNMSAIICIEYKNLAAMKSLINIRRDYVVLLNYNEAVNLSQDEVKYLIEINANICVDTTNGDPNLASTLHSKYIEAGFSRLFHMCTITPHSDNIQQVYGFITPQDLSTFNCEYNTILANEINKLTKNALRRYNKTLVNTVTPSVVLFVNVDTNIYPYFRMPNLGIEYLKSILHNAGYTVQCMYLTRWNMLSELESILNAGIVRVVGFSCMHDNIDAVTNVINHLKSRFKKVVFYIGGPHATALHEAYMRKNSVDYVMVGESENIIIDFISSIILENENKKIIPNLRYIDINGNYVETPKADLVTNLDTLPFPDYVYQRDDNLSAAGVITGRGCPYKCAFCYEGNKERTVRYRSIENVIEEISLILKNNKNVNRIQFYDDTFTLDPSRVLKICDFMKKLYQNNGIMWVCEIHCQTIYNKPDLVRTMVESGMISAQIGLESGNDKILNRLNKKTNLEMILRTVEICKEAGLYSLQGNIIVGAAGENEEDLLNNFDFAKKIIEIGKGMFELGVAMFWPFYNTPIALNPESYGIEVISKQCDYSIHCMGNMVTKTKSVSRQNLVEHFYKLKANIDEIYKNACLELDAKTAKKYWVNGQFNINSVWGRALSTYEHINNYFKAKELIGNIGEIAQGYPIRTFETLSYMNECVTVPNTQLILDILDSRVIELCTGKNTTNEIAEHLKIGYDVLEDIIFKLEDRMLVFISPV